MIYTEKTKEAMKLAYNKHMNQIDKSGVPYIFHPFFLASQMKDEKTTIVALLHDVIEDTDVTFDDLKKMNFADDIISALKLMTHNKEEDYMDYIKKISTNEIAKTVKMADLQHNSDLTRLSNVTEKDRRRAEKYKKALDLLKNIL